jgi:threonine dehydrogenase-like Zn-dependent dehydrogenase
MRGTVLYGPRDIRFEERETPKIVEPTDAIIRIAVTCVCGSDLWPYRGAAADRGTHADGPRVLRRPVSDLQRVKRTTTGSQANSWLA